MANLCYCSLSHSSSYDSHLMLWPPLPPTNVGPALGVAAPLPPPLPPLPPKNVGPVVGRLTGRVGPWPVTLPLETPPMPPQVAAHMRLKVAIPQ